MTRHGRRAVFVFLAFLAISAKAATADFRVLFDVDHDIASGCTVAGMPGVDQVLVTSVTTDDTSAHVTSVYRQVCTAGALGAATDVDSTGWPAGWQADSGSLLLETRVAFAAFGGTLPYNMRIGVQATRDAAAHTALALPGGQEVVFPPLPGEKRRSVREPGEGRVMMLDGRSDDWRLLTPIFDGIAGTGTPALRMLKVFAYADTANHFLYFRFDANLSTDAPFANDDQYARLPGSGVSVAAPGVLENDGDPNGLPLTATPVSTPAHGTITLNPDGSFTYTPDASSTDADSFEYRASNGTKSSNPATVRIVVGASNTAPVAVADNYNATEDTPLNVAAPGVLQNDSDADGDPLTAAIVSAPTNGTVVLNANGGFTYTPSVNYAGTDSFSYSVSDGTAASVATVTITIANENDAPRVRNASMSVVENSATGTIVGSVQVIDPDDTDAHTFSIVGGNSGNAFAINPVTGVITVATPSAVDFETTPQFTLTVRATDDGVPSMFGDGTITINVTNANDAPVAVADGGYTVSEGGTLAGTSVLANDTDAEGDALTAVLVSAPAHSLAFALNADGTFTYTHDGSETSADSFSYRASDGALNSNVVAVTISITPVNDAPVAVADAGYTVAEGGSLAAAATVLANDTDAEANPLTAVLVSGPAHGTLSLNANGTFSYTHDGSETTSDSFTYKANDGALDSNVATVSIVITAVNDAPLFTSADTATIPENTLAAAMVTTSDAEGDTIVYSISGGADAALFSIDSATGALTFLAPPDFENPADADANNQYVVQVTANDGTNSVSQTITITVTDVNDPPAFTSAATASLLENTNDVTIVTTSDPEGDAVTYSISGGADASLFSIDATTGALTFIIAPNYEAPADADANNDYLVQVAASDGTNTATQNLTVTVINFNEAPSFTASPTPSVAENLTAVGTATASDPEGDTLTWSITGGVDAARFTVDAATGALSFTTPPNFEAPSDADSNNVYVVEVTITDGDSIVTQVFYVTVTNVNEAPVITSATSLTRSEGNPALAYTITATDPEGDAIDYAVSFGDPAGPDGARFSYDSATGEVDFLGQPDYEHPTDADANNSYVLVVTATDAGGHTSSQVVTITITNVEEAPRYSGSIYYSTPENTTAVGSVTFVDDEGTTVTYALGAGMDTALFSIDPSTGALAFLAAPNFEAPGDAGGNNVYDVQVQATDGAALTTTQWLQVTVTNVNEAPVFTSSSSVSIPENRTAITTVTATDADGDTLTYSITGGADASHFAIDSSTGALTFNSAPDFEAPTDSDANEIYLVDITVGDGTNTTVQHLYVTVMDADEAPVFISAAAASIPENTVNVGTVVATDPEGSTVSYSISGGADKLKFTINSSTGLLSFIAAPDFEAPGDADANNTYIVTITATDGLNNTPQTIVVTITDANDPPAFTSTATPSVVENTTAVLTVTANDPESDPLTYSITGGADAALFSIDSSTGALAFNSAPNFEAPADADADNVYLVQVTATDGANTTPQDLSVTVTDANEAPSFTSAATATVAENSVTVLTVTTSDPESNPITYSVSGGADQSAFTIDSSTGVLSFAAAPDFEAPADADGNNVYVVDVTANDGTNSVVQTITVTVTDYDEAPEFSSSNNASVAENTTAVMTVAATDPEGASVSYSITGGADAAKFSLSAGALAFVSAPDFEAPSDSDTDNVYVVIVTASDGTNTAPQTISVTVTNVNEAPVNTLQNATQTVDEDTALVFSAANSNLVSISDPDSGATDVQTTLTATNGNVTLPAGALAALTSVTGNGTGTVVMTGTVAEINAAMAGMSFQGTQDYFGSASLAVTTSDLGHTGSGGTQSDGPDSIAITVNAVNDAPVAENKTHATHSALGLTINAATNTGELKENATDVDDAFSELTVQLVPGSVSPANATVTLTSATDGSFYFEPPGGFTGAASFQYKVCDDNVGDPNQCSAAKTVTVNVGGTQLWFIDDTDAAGCGAACNGSRSKPLVGLPASNAAYSGDSVFLFSGNYTGHTLQANERLVGQGASSIVGGLNLNLAVYTNGTLDALPPTGAAPVIGGTITAASGSYLRGVAISSGGSKGYVGSAATAITVTECSVTSANTAVELTGATGATSVSFSSTSSTGGLYGIYLKDVAGSLSFGSGALSGHTTASFAYATTSANTPAISYAGDINPASGARPVDIGITDSGMKGGTVSLSGNIGNVTVPNTGIRIRNGSAGTVNLSGGTIALSTATLNAIEITTNPGVTVNINPATMLRISTTTGRGFLANGGGTINVTGPDNTISSSTGAPFEVYGTSGVRMGGAYTFRSISSNGAAKGITLQYHNGAFTLSGDGSDGDTLPDAAGSGGIINNASTRGAEFIEVTGPVSLGGLNVTTPAGGGAPDATVANGSCGSLSSSGNNTGCFAGLHFDTVSNVSLNTINVSGSGQMGINGNAITNLTMNTVNVSNSGNSAQEEGIRLYNLAGTGSMTAVNVTNSYGIGLNLQSNSGTLASSSTPFLISNSNFQNSTQAQGALLNAMGSATMHVKFVGGTISGNFSNGIQTAGNIGHTGTIGIYVDGTSFSNNTSAVVIQASGGMTQFDVRNITHVARGTNSSYGIGVKTDGGDPGYPAGIATGTFANNFIGNSSVGSGASCGGGCSGISADARNNSRLTITIQNNTVRHVDSSGIMIQGGQGAAKVNATIIGNTISDPDNTPGSLAAIYASAGIDPSDTNCLTATIGSSTPADQNVIQGAWGISGIRLLRKYSPTFNLPGFAGSGTSTADVNAFVASHNVFSGVTTNVTSNVGGAGGFTGGTSCP